MWTPFHWQASPSTARSAGAVGGVMCTRSIARSSSYHLPYARSLIRSSGIRSARVSVFRLSTASRTASSTSQVIRDDTHPGSASTCVSRENSAGWSRQVGCVATSVRRSSVARGFEQSLTEISVTDAVAETIP